jgi:hypothetical protein
LNPSNRGRKQVNQTKLSSKPPTCREQRNHRNEKRTARNHQHDSNQQKRPLKKNKYNKYNNKKQVAFQAADDEESYYSDSNDYDKEEEASPVRDYDYGDYNEEEE